ncbi:MAG: glycosyltransferase family 2 protein [Gammaproteobacteria bacterium]|nr:glycosyltransferase family 2 protein [Gammaproteobacteria bacterium]
MISVLMPVYNGMPYLEYALDSIEDQTQQDIQLVAVDDGSTDDSYKCLRDFQALAGIEVLIVQILHKGIVGALNAGIDWCDGEYIARMDADDISLPTRLATQLSYLDRHPELAGCGAQIMFFGDESRLMEFPIDPVEVRDQMLERTTIAHPTYFLHRKVYEEFRYNPSYEYAEDADFMLRVTERFLIGNTPEVLLYYRADYKRNRSCEDLAAQAASVERARADARRRRCC